MTNKKIIFIVGPTAVGKSAIAVSLARRLKGEIISCDSMQVYKGMDILTSKPKKSLLEKVPHHLISVVSPLKPYDVIMYRKAALYCVKKIMGKGKVPVFCGGTGMYMSVLVDGIFEAGKEDAKFRDKLYEEAKKRGSEYLYKKLLKVDPLAAGKIHPNDVKRIVRALEVFKVTGCPISELQKTRTGLSSEYDVCIFCLDMERDKLYRRIDSRVDRMFKQGLVKEAGNLLKRKLSRTARFAIGLRELEGYFAGKYGLDEARELVKRNSRWYAKRQLTWFRKDKRIHWLKVGSNEEPVKTAERILKWNARY